jgi:hypothetical protein
MNFEMTAATGAFGVTGQGAELAPARSAAETNGPLRAATVIGAFVSVMRQDWLGLAVSLALFFWSLWTPWGKGDQNHRPDKVATLLRRL